MYLNGFDLFSLFNFSKIPFMDSLGILSLETPKNNYIKWYKLCVIKRTAIFEKDLYGCFCEWTSVMKLFKILARKKHHKKKNSW